MNEMDRPAFVYVIYIRSTAEKVWQALIEPEMTRQYWSNHRNTSDWRVGSPWRHEDHDDASLVDISGTILESVVSRRLGFTWATPLDAKAGARLSRVVFEMTEDDGVVRLILTHDQLSEGSDMAEGITEGWPLVLSSLKSLLETGTALPELWIRDGGVWTRNSFA
jgi:uncharacterized protein YndB with AHSA1/START domain